MSEDTNPSPVPPADPAELPKSQMEAKTSGAPSSVIIRPWPKVIFFYPTFILATVGWLICLASGDEAGQNAFGKTPADWYGKTFMLVFFLNLLVFAFDFSRIKSITILAVGIAVTLGYILAEKEWPVLGDIKSWVGHVNPQMNQSYYGLISLFFLSVFLLVLINTRFNYYEVNHREILHHHGYLGDVTRMPTQGLRLNKKIYDLVEYALLQSGRLIFHPAGGGEPIVIDNVLKVNRVEARLNDLLSVIAVRSYDNRS